MKDNIKNQILKIKNMVQRSKFFDFLYVILIFSFLFFNLTYSQIVSPIYFRFVNNDKNAAVDFLEKIKKLPEFQKILEMNKNIYGKTIEKEVFRQENNEISMINNLEQQLRINPKARDILFRLYLLYKEKGDNLTAEKYLKQAREMDPTLR